MRPLWMHPDHYGTIRRGIIFSFGYSFHASWQPRLSFVYHYGSGDKDPLDNDNELITSRVPRPTSVRLALSCFSAVNTSSPARC